jgi:hypothetical protein
MNDDSKPPVETIPMPPARSVAPSTTQRLIEEMIALRESTGRQLKFFEQTIRQLKEDSQANFSGFVTETTKAYQQIRQELHGEKRHSLALQSELLEVSLDLARIVSARPPDEDAATLVAWADSVGVLERKVEAMIERLGIRRWDAAIGSPYNPALHERIGSKRIEGMGPLLVAEQLEPGYASVQPEFVLRRPRILVSE